MESKASKVIPIKYDISRKQVAPGDKVRYVPGSLTEYLILKIPNHSDNTPNHIQGDLHLEGLKPLLWVNAELEIISRDGK